MCIFRLQKIQINFYRQFLCGFNWHILHLKFFKIISNLWSNAAAAAADRFVQARSISWSNVKQFQTFKTKRRKKSNISIFKFHFELFRSFRFQFCICARMCLHACINVADNNYVIFIIYHRIAPNRHSNWSITGMIKHFSCTYWSKHMKFQRFVVSILLNIPKAAKFNKLTTHLWATGGYRLARSIYDDDDDRKWNCFCFTVRSLSFFGRSK